MEEEEEGMGVVEETEAVVVADFLNVMSVCSGYCSI